MEMKAPNTTRRGSINCPYSRDTSTASQSTVLRGRTVIGGERSATGLPPSPLTRVPFMCMCCRRTRRRCASPCSTDFNHRRILLRSRSESLGAPAHHQNTPSPAQPQTAVSPAVQSPWPAPSDCSRCRHQASVAQVLSSAPRRFQTDSLAPPLPPPAPQRRKLHAHILQG